MVNFAGTLFLLSLYVFLRVKNEYLPRQFASQHELQQNIADRFEIVATRQLQSVVRVQTRVSKYLAILCFSLSLLNIF